MINRSRDGACPFHAWNNQIYCVRIVNNICWILLKVLVKSLFVLYLERVVKVSSVMIVSVEKNASVHGLFERLYDAIPIIVVYCFVKVIRDGIVYGLLHGLLIVFQVVIFHLVTHSFVSLLNKSIILKVDHLTVASKNILLIEFIFVVWFFV